MKALSKVAIACICTLSLGSAVADPAKSQKQADRSVELRQAVLTLMGSNMGPMGAMARGKAPMNVETVAKNSERIVQLSLMLEDYFKTDTTGFKTETEALDKIWKNQADFNTKASDLTAAAKALYAASQSGDESALPKAIGAVGKTCGGCHDDYKKD